MKALFIAPIFYSYEKMIKKSLEARYEKVFFRGEIPFNLSVFFEIIKRTSSLVAKKISKKYNSYLLNLAQKNTIDVIFIIRGCEISEEFLSTIKSQNPLIKIINYQWDSLHNNPNGLLISKYADKNYSFDIADVEKYRQFFHIPLFYAWNNVNLNLSNNASLVDVYFLGSFHSQRHIIINDIQTQFKKQAIVMKSHIFIPWLVYIRRKITGEKLLDKSNVSFKKISRQKYHSSILNSRAVLDIPSSTQTGATIRTIEALSLNRKVISTNLMLQKEKFYSPNNILLINTKEGLDIGSFLAEKFDDSKNSEIFNLEQWLDKIGI